MMQSYTEEQRAAEIEQAKELRNQLNFWGHASGFDAEFLMRATDAYLASLAAKPVSFEYRWKGEPCHQWTPAPLEKYLDTVAAFGDAAEYRLLYAVPPVTVLRLPDPPPPTEAVLMNQIADENDQSKWRVDVMSIEHGQTIHSVETTGEAKAQKLEQAMLNRIDRSRFYVSATPCESA